MVYYNELQDCIYKELESRNKKGEPDFRSTHEAYAVLREVLDDFNESAKQMNEKAEVLWSDVKLGDDVEIKANIQAMKLISRDVFDELVKVCAMIKKFEAYERSEK